MSINNYDERQMYARGIAFRWTTFTFLMEIVVWGVIREIWGIDAEPLAEMLLLMMVPFMVFGLICISKDAYDPINSRPGMLVFALMPIAGILMIVDKIKEHALLVDGLYITQDFGLVAVYTAWIVLAIAYWIVIIKERRSE